METVKITIKGKTPLLMNRFRSSQIESKTKKRTGAVVEDDYTSKLYLTEDEKPYVPSAYLRGMLIEAGKQFKIQGKGKATYSKLLGSAIEVNPDAIEIISEGYKPFVISAVNPTTKGRMIVKRPMFEDWSLKFEIAVLDDGVPVDVLKDIIEHGGNYVGIGDWRPNKKGKYGKFMVTEYSIM